MFPTYYLAASVALCGSTSAHMILANPKPYGNPNNSPLSSSGSNYPCQISGSAATFYSTDGLSNSATAGESVIMSFTGSAVHGGGSCQVALSTDMQPSKSTRWSVILSIEGGCPTKDGTAASTYDVKIPSDIPAGEYSYAWTWTSKLSGTQEYYMNCAPITIKAAGGSKKRSQNIRVRNEALDSYPPLAVYNLADLNSCKSTLSSSALYPLPGPNVEKLAASDPAYAKITGSDCFASGVTYEGSTSGGGGGESSSSSPPIASTKGSYPTPPTTISASGAPSFVVSSPVATTAVSAVIAPSQAASGSSASAPGGTGTSPGSSSSSSSGSSSGASSSGTCRLGQYNCLSGGKSYQMCLADSQWSITMSVADGTKCTPGTSTNLAISALSAKKRRGLTFLF